MPERYGTYQKMLNWVIISKQEYLSKMKKNLGCREGKE